MKIWAFYSPFIYCGLWDVESIHRFFAGGWLDLLLRSLSSSAGGAEKQHMQTKATTDNWLVVNMDR
jgi:hypothetical protein